MQNLSGYEEKQIEVRGKIENELKTLPSIFSEYVDYLVDQNRAISTVHRYVFRKNRKEKLKYTIAFKSTFICLFCLFLDIKNNNDAHHNLEKIRNRNYNRFDDKYIGNGVALQFDGEYETKKEN